VADRRQDLAAVDDAFEGGEKTVEENLRTGDKGPFSSTYLDGDEHVWP
jgi:hypothetical protein